MSKRRRVLPIALTIAGSDSGGGAGIQADLRTFASLGVHGTSAITCVTAQNPREVLGIEACSVRIVRQQLEAVFGAFTPAAVKTGMLFSGDIIRAVVDFVKKRPAACLVVDPVMVSTSGTQLLKSAALKILTKELLPLATLITPNVAEAEALTGARLEAVEDLRQAARVLHERFGCAALVKGGHLRGLKVAVDIFFDGSQELLLSAPFVRNLRTHGTGCTYSAAIAGFSAQGHHLPEAVGRAKEYITQAIVQSQMAGGRPVLNTSWS